MACRPRRSSSGPAGPAGSTATRYSPPCQLFHHAERNRRIVREMQHGRRAFARHFSASRAPAGAFFRPKQAFYAASGALLQREPRRMTRASLNTSRSPGRNMLGKSENVRCRSAPIALLIVKQSTGRPHRRRLLGDQFRREDKVQVIGSHGCRGHPVLSKRQFTRRRVRQVNSAESPCRFHASSGINGLGAERTENSRIIDFA